MESYDLSEFKAHFLFWFTLGIKNNYNM